MMQKTIIPNIVLLRWTLILNKCNYYFPSASNDSKLSLNQLKTYRMNFYVFQIIDTMALHMPPEKIFQHIVSDYLHVLIINVKCVRPVEFYFFHPFILPTAVPCRVAHKGLSLLLLIILFFKAFNYFWIGDLHHHSILIFSRCPLLRHALPVKTPIKRKEVWCVLQS